MDYNFFELKYGGFAIKQLRITSKLNYTLNVDKA